MKRKMFIRSHLGEGHGPC